MSSYLNLEGLTHYNNRVQAEINNKSDKAVIESFTVTSDSWVEDNTISPFHFKKTFTVLNLLGANTIVTSSLDILQKSTCGITVGSVSGQDVTIYAARKPEVSINISIIMRD